LAIMYKRIFLCIIFLPQAIDAQIQHADIVFWNVENYYDPFSNHWSWSRFIAKRDALSKTIIAMGADELPVLIGLCEVESRFALEQLVRQTPLSLYGYRIVHRDGPDERGIDVALLYRSDRFRLLLSRFLRVRLPDTTQHTREILYAKGVLDDLDTLHIFVNHWPSKRGGAKISASRRMAAAMRLKAGVDSVFLVHPIANIVIMGDFNDTPLSKVMQTFYKGCNLHNLSVPLARQKQGTIRYRGRWELIDQFMVSENLLNRDEPIYTSADHCRIFTAPFLLIRDEKFLGMKPFRTYLGPRYQGGISDHLPVILRIERNY